MEKLNLANLSYSPKLETKEQEKDFFDTWFICLGRYDGDLFAKAIFKIMLTETTYPSIAKVREFVVTEIRNNRANVKQLNYEPKPSGEEAEHISKILTDLKEKLLMKNKIKEQQRDE